uniref:Uncharacterized protein n=1 Tax=Canis lupus familiaris TaxID=9615 RepID=A0A8I3PVD2_CANLF
MWWAPLPLPLLLLPTALRPGWAGPPQERGPPFRPTPQDPRASGAGNATASASACEGLPAAGASTLSLANRSLERLPGCLPPALRSLDGSRNLLRALSAAELGHLPRLRALTLSHNRIAALRWGPGGPAALHTLDLSYNRLAALPPCAGPALPGLRSLGLAGNPLRALQPRAFACLPALRLLNLSSTALGRDPGAGIADGAFAGAGGALEVLDLSGTFLERGEFAAGLGGRPRWAGAGVRGVRGASPEGGDRAPRSRCGSKITPPRFLGRSGPCSKVGTVIPRRRFAGEGTEARNDECPARGLAAPARTGHPGSRAQPEPLLLCYYPAERASAGRKGGGGMALGPINE